MLSMLCGRINEQSKDILNDQYESEHGKYLKMYDHIKKSDKIVANCFNDWRRSNIWLKVQFLWKHQNEMWEYVDQEGY